MWIWMLKTVSSIILCMGFYFWRERPSQRKRIFAAGLCLATFIIVSLGIFVPQFSTKPHGTGEQPVQQDISPSRSQNAITAPAEGTAMPDPPEAQPAQGKTAAPAAVAETASEDLKPVPAPVSNPTAATEATTELTPVVATVNDEQLDALIGDAIPVKLEGSTMVDTIVKKGDIQAANRQSQSEDDYSFPEVVEGPGGLTMIIPDEPLPAVSSRRQLTTTDDEIPETGEVVALTYDMFSWSTGKMVESSKTILNGPLMFRLGGQETPIGIPQYLDEAIHNRPYGSTIQVVFEKEMSDLPGYMDPKDGYVLVVRIDRPDVDDETALERMQNPENL